MSLLDRFELVRVLGQGAFGTTFLGRERASGRAVAIKHLPLRGLPGWKPVELLEREARVLRSLAHPGVPAFIDALEVGPADGAGEPGPGLAIVTEYVEGPTLQAEITRGRRWSAGEARALMRALLETLDYLHSLSPRVIHRDIKPGNVIVRPDGRPVLVDFGSVRDVAAQPLGEGMTIAGTAGYMAPEQAYGIADVRSDLHGLAATLAHVLTHVHPKDLPRTGLRPRLRDLTGIDDELAGILERLLEPEPERRMGSAAEVLRALDGGAVVRVDPEAGTSLARGTDAAAQAALARLAETPRLIDGSLTRLLEARDPTRSNRSCLAVVLFFVGAFTAVGVGLAGQRALAMLVFVASFVGLFVVPGLNRGAARRIFTDGRVTLGSIRTATPSEGSLRLTYTFRHEGHELEGSLEVNDAFVAKHVEPNTPVLVFYDPAEPSRSLGLLADELPSVANE